MGTVISQIDFTAVKLQKEKDQEYTLQLCWSLNGGYMCDYKGEYTFCLYENGVPVKNETVVDERGALECSLKLSGISIDRTYQITLEVPVSAGGARTPKLKLIVDSIIEQSGVLDNDALELRWRTGTGRCPVLLCEVQGSNGMYDQYYASAAAGCFKISASDFLGAETVDVCLSLTDKGKVQGPKSEKLHFCLCPLLLLSAELVKKEHTSVIKLCLQSEDASLQKVKLLCMQDQDSLAECKDIPALQQADGNFTAETEIPQHKIPYETLARCMVCVAAVWDTAESCVPDAGSRMALGAPALRLDEMKGKKLRLSVASGHLPYPPVGYELPDGAFLSGSSFTADFDPDFSIHVLPRFDRNGCVRKGTPSNSVTSFLPGYYPQKDETGTEYLQFYQSSFTEGQISRMIPEELFAVRLTGELVQGPISLTPLEKGYRITIDVKAPLSRENYEKWIDQIKDSITPYGFYLLCDILLRIAPQAMEDTPYFQCAFLPQRGTADVRPGLQLRLTTAVYQPRYDPNIADSAGYAAMYSQEYPVTIKKKGVYLEFDRYVGAIAEYSNLSDISDQKTNVVFASGIADCMQPSARQPYYRILYPEKLTHDYAVETPYPSDNVVLLTADNYGAILEASDAVAQNRAAINNLPLTVVIFKGRSTLSLHMPVEFNGCRLSVPVGSTLQEVLLQQGIYAGEGCRLYRLGCDGREYPVLIQFAEDLDQLVLVSGDRIVCRN